MTERYLRDFEATPSKPVTATWGTLIFGTSISKFGKVERGIYRTIKICALVMTILICITGFFSAIILGSA